jgi:hypothetical protein
MTEIIEKKETDLIDQNSIDNMTRLVLNLPQADCPVAHYFGPGIYLRQVTFPAGIFAIGHKQRFEQINIFVAGRVAMLQPDGNLKELKAPMIFNGPPGQKMGIILETVTWLNAYPNPDNCRDIDVLEDRFLDKQGPWTESDHSVDRNEDRQDFEKICNEIDLPILDDDIAELPEGFDSVITIRSSDIHGKGVFASWPFEEGAILGPLKVNGRQTILRAFINHAAEPNCAIDDQGYLYALRRINGCRGGDRGEEITIDYRELIQCQQP